MTKKNRKKKNIQNTGEGGAGGGGNPIEANQSGQNAEAEVVEEEKKLIEADQARLSDEAAEADRVSQDEAVSEPKAEESGEEIQEPATHSDVDESSENDLMDDLLADVRSSLIEEDEATKGGKKSSWWNRLVKGPAGQTTPVEETPAEPVKESPAEKIHPTVEIDTQDSDEHVEEIDELIKLLENEDLETQKEAFDVQIVSPAVEQEARVDIDELKRQAFTQRTEEEVTEELGDVRQIALDGEEEVFVEVEARKEDPWEERIKSVENALRPYRTYIYYGLAFIGVVMAVMASVLIYNGVKATLPTPEPTEVVNMPFPTSITLPGGLNFGLGKGALKDGTWEPGGPEWLEGTEICRWVALPWSRQLEAAIRTMNREDVIELVMSNNDKLSYQVESIQELTPAELQEMDSSTPCLALILAKQDSEKRWVVIGRP